MTPLPWCARTGVKITARIAISYSAWSRTAYWPSLTRSVARECGSSRPDWPNPGNDDATMKRTAKGKPKIDWSRVDAMTEAERHAAAVADPDARPMTDAEWARAPRVPQVSIIRRALKLSQEQFATTFHIPIGTIRTASALCATDYRRICITSRLHNPHALEHTVRDEAASPSKMAADRSR